MAGAGVIRDRHQHEGRNDHEQSARHFVASVLPAARGERVDVTQALRSE
jgi:hypothetical protein